MMPCAVIGSLLYPASPTSTQPGPYGLRKKFGTAPPVNRSARVGRAYPLGELGDELERLEEVGLRGRPGRPRPRRIGQPTTTIVRPSFVAHAAQPRSGRM